MNRWTALLGASLLFAASQASAADCVAAKSISEAVDAKHEFVLKGKVLRVRSPLVPSGIVPVMFSLIRAYRGAPPQIITVYFDPAQDKRSLSFHKGDVWAISTVPAGPDAPAEAKTEPGSVGNACTLRQLIGVSR